MWSPSPSVKGGVFSCILITMANKTKVKSLDKVFSQFIRLRDSKDGAFMCCSCRQYKPYEQADAGHFINRKWMTTRWREDNVHAQCRACNRFDEGNSAGYAMFMIRKYGESHVDYLEGVKRDVAKYTDFELDLMIKDYKAKIKALTSR